MHIPGPPDAKRSIDSRSRSRSTMKSRSSVTSRLVSVIEFRRIGSPFTISDFFANGPSSLPSKIRGGVTLPSAIPIAAEGGEAGDGFGVQPKALVVGIGAAATEEGHRDVDQARVVRAVRSVITFTAAGSKRLFTYTSKFHVVLDCPVLQLR